MNSISPLDNVIKKGLFGNYEGKSDDNLIKINEVKSLLIVQIVQYKNSTFQITNVNIDGLNLTDEALKVKFNNDTRILWCGPKNWLVASNKKNLLESLKRMLNENDFAITDLSHSRAIIEIEGQDAIEVLKKGCPFNFDIFEKNNSINSSYNGIAFTADMLDNNPDKVRLFTLRSFGESLYHSITDACLEFGFKSL